MPATERGTTRSGGSRVREFLRRRWLAVALIMVVIIFVVQNRTSAPIQLFTVQVSLPQWLILAIILAVGLLAGYLLGRVRRRRN